MVANHKLELELLAEHADIQLASCIYTTGSYIRAFKNVFFENYFLGKISLGIFRIDLVLILVLNKLK